MLSLQKRLAKHLKAADGNLGRTGRAITMLAENTGISVSMIQSVARGSRKFSDTNADTIAVALYKAELAWAPVLKQRKRRRG
jgi:hypothetical protein